MFVLRRLYKKPIIVVANIHTEAGKGTGTCGAADIVAAAMLSSFFSIKAVFKPLLEITPANKMFSTFAVAD